MVKSRIVLLVISLFSFWAWSCTPDDPSPKALVNVFLVDAPASWDSVIVELEGVELEIIAANRAGQLESIVIPYELADKKVDVAQLVAGVSLPIGRKEIALGTLTGIKLRLGTSHQLFQGEKGYSLPIPNQETEFPTNISLELQAGISYDIYVDLDLERSIQVIKSSPLELSFQPQIAAFSTIDQGQIQGTLSPSTLSPVIYAIQGSDSLSTQINGSGTFLFRLNPGTYTLFFDPKDERYAPTTRSGISVEKGKVTTLERITFSTN